MRARGGFCYAHRKALDASWRVNRVYVRTLEGSVVRKTLRILVIPFILTISAWGDVLERITPYRGDAVDGITGTTFDGERFSIPGHDAVPRTDVQQIEFRQEEKREQAGATPAGSEGLTPLAQAQLDKAQQLAKASPGISGVILLDVGEFVYREDGTDSYRYHFAGVVLKEEMKSWAQVTCGFTEGRSRVRLLFGRSVAPDGTVRTLTPEMLKVGSPSEEMVFFSPTRKILSGVIPGVEVGSIVEYCYEYDNYNPEDKRLFSPGFFFQGTEPIVLSQVKVQLPKEIEFKYVTRHFPAGVPTDPKIEESSGTKTYVWQFEMMPPVTPEPMMPPEQDVVPMMEGCIFKSFEEAFGLLAELQKARLRRTPEIDAKAQEITKDAQTIDDKIAQIYYWVQENTRYISIKGSLGAGFSGHTAQETFDNRYGDCTDKAILFCTMLESIGVESYPIIVYTNDAGTAVTEIPTLSGNHCITEVCLPGRNFYLDSTAQNYRYPYFRMDDHGIPAFNAIRGDIRPIPVPPPSDNRRLSRLDVMLEANGDALVKTVNEYNGNVEAGVRGFWKRAREDSRKLMMSEYVNSISPGAQLQDFTLNNLEDLAKPLSMTIDYALPGHGIRAKDLMYLRMPTLEREYPEVSLETRQYPVQYMTTEERILEINLTLPKGFRSKWLPPPLEIKNAYVEYKGQYEEEAGHVRLHEEFRRLQRIVPVADYGIYRDALRSIATFSKQEIFLTQEG